MTTFKATADQLVIGDVLVGFGDLTPDITAKVTKIHPSNDKTVLEIALVRGREPEQLLSEHIVRLPRDHPVTIYRSENQQSLEEVENDQLGAQLLERVRDRMAEVYIAPYASLLSVELMVHAGHKCPVGMLRSRVGGYEQAKALLSGRLLDNIESFCASPGRLKAMAAVMDESGNNSPVADQIWLAVAKEIVHQSMAESSFIIEFNGAGVGEFSYYWSDETTNPCEIR